MADFKKDDNGLFKTYFNFCDEAKDGVLSPQDDAACKERLEALIQDRLQKWVELILFERDYCKMFLKSEYNIQFDEQMMAQANGMKAMMTSFGEQIFNELIDSNHDGQATLDEIEMVWSL